MFSTAAQSIAKPFAFAAVLLSAAALFAAEPTTPREVALAFAKATRAGDVAAAKQYAVGSEKSFQTLEIMAKTWKAMDAIFIEIEKTALADREDEMKMMKQMAGIEPSLEVQAAAAVEAITGDTATLTDPESPREAAAAPQSRPAGAVASKRDKMPEFTGDPVMLKKLDGKWKVDLDATFAAKGMNNDKGIAVWTNMQAEVDKLHEAIKAGKIPPRSRPATRPAGK